MLTDDQKEILNKYLPKVLQRLDDGRFDEIKEGVDAYGFTPKGFRTRIRIKKKTNEFFAQHQTSHISTKFGDSYPKTRDMTIKLYGGDCIYTGLGIVADMIKAHLEVFEDDDRT